jgi:hypothetical protein
MNACLTRRMLSVGLRLLLGLSLRCLRRSWLDYLPLSPFGVGGNPLVGTCFPRSRISMPTFFIPSRAFIALRDFSEMGFIPPPQGDYRLQTRLKLH